MKWLHELQLTLCPPLSKCTDILKWFSVWDLCVFCKTIVKDITNRFSSDLQCFSSLEFFLHRAELGLCSVWKSTPTPSMQVVALISTVHPHHQDSSWPSLFHGTDPGFRICSSSPFFLRCGACIFISGFWSHYSEVQSSVSFFSQPQSPYLRTLIFSGVPSL